MIQTPYYIPTTYSPYQAEADRQMAKAYADYQKESALIQDRTAADMKKASMKAEMDISTEERLMKLRQDIRLEASCLSEAFYLAEDGSVERKQEFLLKQPKQYKSSNFKLLSAHRLCDPEGIFPAILQLEIQLENGVKTAVFVDVGRGSGRYYAKKLREAGARLKLKRGETNDIYEAFMSAVMQMSVDCVLPKTHGFYRSSTELCYAGKQTLTRQEVMEYVK